MQVDGFCKTTGPLPAPTFIAACSSVQGQRAPKKMQQVFTNMDWCWHGSWHWKLYFCVKNIHIFIYFHYLVRIASNPFALRPPHYMVAVVEIGRHQGDIKVPVGWTVHDMSSNEVPDTATRKVDAKNLHNTQCNTVEWWIFTCWEDTGRKMHH